MNTKDKNGAATQASETPQPETKPAPKAATKPIELLNKLVAKNIVTKRSALTYSKDSDGKLVDDAPRKLYRIWGTASGVRHGDSTYGQWTAFTGNFKAIRFSDTQWFQAPEAFLNGAAETLLLDALTLAQKDDPSASVTFAFDVGVRPSSKWVTEDKGNSYEYTIQTVLESQQHDPLAALTEEVLKSLPAPTTV